MYHKDEGIFITLCNAKGEEVKCTILFTFVDTTTGKEYMVFTDNTEDEEGYTRVYANQLDTNENNFTLLPINEERIWSVIEEMLAEMQKDK